jgi:hypothetical protein
VTGASRAFPFPFPAGLAAALLACPELETVEVDWLDDISVAGDHANG